MVGIWAVLAGIDLIGMLLVWLFVLLFIVSSSEFDVSSITSNVEHDGDDGCDDWKKAMKQIKVLIGVRFNLCDCIYITQKQTKLFLHTLEIVGGVFVCRICNLLSTSVSLFASLLYECIVNFCQLKRNLKEKWEMTIYIYQI